MRKAARLAALIVGLCGSTVSADERLLGKEFTTPSHGQPMCADQESLFEYMLAAVNQDNQWAQQVKGCTMLKAGLKVVVLEDVPSDSEIAHVVKIRVFIARGSSAVGYTLSVGLQPKE